MIAKIKGTFKRTLAKEGKGGKFKIKKNIQKEYGDGGLRW